MVALKTLMGREGDINTSENIFHCNRCGPILLLIELWAPTSDFSFGFMLLLVFYEIGLSLLYEALQLRVLNLQKWEENPCVKFKFFS